jgi:hypothetical protein
MSGTSFLETKIEEIRSRLADLAPAYHEHVALEKALDAIMQNLPPAPPKPAVPAAPAPVKAPAPVRRAKAAAKPAKGRPRKARQAAKQRRPSGSLKKELLSLVRQTPGLTAADLAGKLGCARPSLFTLARRLEHEGLLTRKDVETGTRARVGFFPV